MSQTLRVVFLVFAVFFGISLIRNLPTNHGAAISPAARTAQAYENASITMVIVTAWAIGQMLRRRGRK
jgi:hypothetical protein